MRCHLLDQDQSGMSLEGIMKKIKNYKLRYAVQPGLTGWAQVMYSYGASVKDCRDKIRV